MLHLQLNSRMKHVHLLPEAGSHEGCIDIKRVGASAACMMDCIPGGG